MPNVRQLVGHRNCLAGFRERSGDIGSFSAAFRGFIPLVAANRFRHILAAWKPGPFGPFCCSGNSARCTNRFPFVGREDSDEITFLHDFGGRELLFVDGANGDERRAQRCGTNHPGVKHSRQRDVTAPLRFAGDFVGNSRHGIGGAHYLTLIERR